MEKWESVPKYPSYLVSNKGRLKRLPFTRVNTKGETVNYKMRWLKPVSAGRYFLLDVWDNGKRIDRIYIHRLVYELFKGIIPKGHEIDHINGNTCDNSIENLRSATRTQNEWNKRAKGYYYHKQSGLYHAKVMSNGKVYSLGYYKTGKEAKHAYSEGCKKYHKGFCARKLA